MGIINISFSIYVLVDFWWRHKPSYQKFRHGSLGGVRMQAMFEARLFSILYFPFSYPLNKTEMYVLNASFHLSTCV